MNLFLHTSKDNIKYTVVGLHLLKEASVALNIEKCTFPLTELITCAIWLRSESSKCQNTQQMPFESYEYEQQWLV